MHTRTSTMVAVVVSLAFLSTSASSLADSPKKPQLDLPEFSATARQKGEETLRLLKAKAEDEMVKSLAALSAHLDASSSRESEAGSVNRKPHQPSITQPVSGVLAGTVARLTAYFTQRTGTAETERR